MIRTISLMVLLTAMAAAQDRSAAAPDRSNARRGDSAAAQSAKPAVSSTAPALPKGAIEVEPNLYRYTDAQGRKWLTRRTPFGFSTWEDKPAPAQPVAIQPAQADAAPLVQATDLGDTVRFERATPFGKSTWVRKKTELNEDEQAWLRAAQSRKVAPQPKPADSPASGTEKR